MAETKLSNRGMKLNEAKKLKRENLAREQAAAAAAAAAAEAQGIPIPISLTVGIEEDAPEKLPTRASKRKLEEFLPADATAQASDESRASRLTKRRKASDDDIPTDPRASLSSASVNTSTSVTATANVPVENSAPIVDIKKPSPPPAELKAEPAAAAPAPAPSTDDHFATPNRPPSRGRSISLAEQATTLNAPGGRDLRRKSATPARRTPIPVPETGPTRRRKRPAPGPVSSGQDGGAAVSYGRRKAKMSKKRPGTREPDQRDNVRIDEDGVLEEIDSNEPRYCMCGDVSFGTMICCENPDVSRRLVCPRYYQNQS